MINTNPSFDSGGGPEASYILDSAGGIATVIQLSANDPEGIPIQWSYVASDSAQYFADITNDSSVFTITAKDTATIQQYDSAGGTFSITFKASDGVNLATALSEFTIGFAAPPGGALFTTVGQHTWTVPDGVTSVCVVCIGAGGGNDDVPQLSSAIGKNQILTTAHSWFKSTTHLIAQGGSSSFNGGQGGTSGGTLLTQGYSGGQAGQTNSQLGGGGGAAGYGGNGGNGALSNGVPPGGGGVGVYGGDPSAGGAGGGNGNTQTAPGVNGGTDGGEGQSGWGLVIPGEFGGGRGGDNRNNTNRSNRGGGGGALAYANNVIVTPGEQINIQVGDGRGGRITGNITARPGGMGAVRIIWGEGRAFPNTNADLASSSAGETTI